MFMRSVKYIKEPQSTPRSDLSAIPRGDGFTRIRGSRWHRIMGLLVVYTIMSFMVVKVVSTAALQQQQHQQQQQQQQVNQPTERQVEVHFDRKTEEEKVLPETTGVESDNFGDSQSSAAERQNIEKMRAKLQQLQFEQQQQYRQQQLQMQLHLQQMHQQMQQQMQLQLHANGVSMVADEGGAGGGGDGGAASETAYLLERVDDVAPIYGTWRTKARRPQPPAMAVQHATSKATHQHSVLGDDDASTNNVYDNHLYERVPMRSVTMTPLRDQMARPPRLSTQRPPSGSLVRRQYSESPGSLGLRDDYKPKPFHFPFDGPMPEHFKKGEGERATHVSLNNIQDILHNLHINNVMSTKMPPLAGPSLVMMPTGLHIAGSYKNLKSSGIANFLRGKRSKKQMQFSIPLPMMPMAMPMSLYGAPPNQRVAIDQLYPYKPRSPQDINLLALQPSSKPNSKKNKKHQQQVQGHHSMLLEHGSQQPFLADPFMQSFPSIVTFNASKQPQHKRVPFKVNLDIYPVLPPSRPTSVLRNPFPGDYALPSVPSTGSVYAQPNHQHGMYQIPFKFPTQSPNHNPMSFPDQASHYSHQQALYQSQKIVKQPPIDPSVADDCSNNNGNVGDVDTYSNQIMLHLNVFPKQKSAPAMRPSTNPFYNHNYNAIGTGLQRNAIIAGAARETPLPKPPSPIEPRQVEGAQSNTTTTLGQAHQNQTHQLPQQQHPYNPSISRSDNVSLLDFEHPIVAAEVPQLPHASPLIAHPPSLGRYDNFRYQKNSHIDQLAAEAQTASLFRFPVEDLIQFQVDDAL